MSPPKGVHTNESDIITDCNHQFCKSCIDTWINKKLFSIKCNTKINSNIVVHLLIHTNS